MDGVAGGGGSVGTIQGSGNTVLYTAPGVAGSHTVAATSTGGGNTSVASAVTVAATVYTVVNPGSVYNVETGYGAAGNGSTDDTAAIQNAINAAAAAGGGLVEVPSGTYLIDLGYQEGGIGLLMKSNVTLQLDAGATLKAMAGAPADSDMVMFSGGSSMNLVGQGVLDGNRGVIGLAEGIKNVCILGGTTSCWPGSPPRTRPATGSTSTATLPARGSGCRWAT